MPSRVSWPVMDRPTAHPTGVTLASGDPHSSLNAPEGRFGRHLPLEVALRLVPLEGHKRYRALVVGQISETIFHSWKQAPKLAHILLRYCSFDKTR